MNGLKNRLKRGVTRVRKTKISNYLHHGQEYAIPGRELVQLLGLDDVREISKLVELERHSGIPICASTDPKCPGYYLAADAVEFESYIRSLDRRIKNISVTRNSCQDALCKLSGQLTID